MTYSNGSYNPNPLANPFNARLGPANYSLNPTGQSYSGNKFNSSRKDLPEPVMLGDNPNDNLHVPHSNERPFMLSEIQGMIDSYASNKTWNDNDINRLPSNSLEVNPGLSRKDIEYWQHADLQTKKLSSNMSDMQKQMMAEYERHFPPSKFEDEL